MEGNTLVGAVYQAFKKYEGKKERKTREMAILRSGELVLLSKVDSLEKAKGWEWLKVIKNLIVKFRPLW